MDDQRTDEQQTVGRFVTSDGVTLRVADTGGPTGPDTVTLVLLHGWSQDLRTWDRVVDDLRAAGETVRVLRHDHRGHGGSDAAPRGTATVARAADDAAELIADRVPTGRLVLAGHSMGGMTLMALAERHPELVASRVSGVALVATASDDMADLTLDVAGRRGKAIARGERLLAPLVARLGHRAPADRAGHGSTAPARRADGPPPAVRARAAAITPSVRLLVFGPGARREDVASVAEQTLAADPASIVAFRASISEHARRHALDALRGVPVVVLVGGRDRLCPVRHARVIAEALPDAEFVLFPGAGHMITYERDAEVTAHLRGLLAAAAGVPSSPEESRVHAAV